MSLRGDYLTIRLQQHSSGVTNEVIADTISCSMDFSGEALDSTSQDDGLIADFIAGKLSATVSGDYLLMSDADQFSNLFTHISAGNLIEVELYQDSTRVLGCEGIITSLTLGGANSDSLATGAYSMQVTGAVTEGTGYGPELATGFNTAAFWSSLDSGWSVDEGVSLDCDGTASAWATKNSFWDVAKTYKVVITNTRVSGDFSAPYDGVGIATVVSTATTTTYEFLTAGTNMTMYSRGGFSGKITALSIKEKL